LYTVVYSFFDYTKLLYYQCVCKPQTHTYYMLTFIDGLAVFRDVWLSLH